MYGNINDVDVKSEVVQRGSRPPLPSVHDYDTQKPMDRTVYNLLVQCWDENPTYRPEIEVVRQRLKASGYHVL